MTKRRKNRRARRRQQTTDTASVAERERAEVQAAVAAADTGDTASPADDDPENLDDLIEELIDGDVLVRLVCGPERRLQTFAGKTIAGAAEEAAVTYVASLGRFPADAVSVECWTNFGQFGPFPIELSLVADAQTLRGDADR